MKFIELPTGDVINERLGAKVYNELRSFGNEETKRSIRLKDKDEKAMNDISIDMKSRLILLKWIDIGDFDRIEGFFLFLSVIFRKTKSFENSVKFKNTRLIKFGKYVFVFRLSLISLFVCRKQL